MKLMACLYIDDDGLGGTLSIYDSPCSQPMCLHADLPLSPGEVACVLEYITHGMREPVSALPRVVARCIAGNGIIAFEPTHMSVQLKGDLGNYSYSNLAAALTIARENVVLDMSNDWGDDLLGDRYCSWCSPEGV